MNLKQGIKSAQTLTIRILESHETARHLEVAFPHLNKTLHTPNFITTTKGGALNGMIKPNLKDIDYPIVSLNYADMYSYTDVLGKYQRHLSQTKEGGNVLKRYFNYDDKVVMLTPFPYSMLKERVGGFNDEQHLQLNGRDKVKVNDYYKLWQETKPDFVVAPCEQVNAQSGKKKRKRAAKSSFKYFQTLQKLMKDTEEEHNSALLLPLILGDEDGIDSYELIHLRKTLNEDHDYYYQGFMVYGTDGQKEPEKYQDMKSLFATLPQDKIRALHGPGSPVDVLNAVLGGIDIYESDYPLERAQEGIAVLISAIDIKSSKKREPKQGLELSKILDTKQTSLLNLSNPVNRESALPIVEGCRCYTCRNYNRAYLHHLLDVKEMNANILIGIHNMWVYNLLFEQLRANIGSLEEFIESFIEVNCINKA